MVFVCEHGSAKSVVAAAHFNHMAARRGLAVRAVSRGITPDAELAPPALDGLRADGLEPPESVPREIDDGDVRRAERLITFNDLPSSLPRDAAIERWEVPPVSEGYAAARDALLRKIEHLLDGLAVEDD